MLRLPLTLSAEPPLTFLRYGMAPDKGIIGEDPIRELYDGILMPAHILAFFHEAVPAFLFALEKPYLVDPMTFMYQRMRSYSDDWGTRRSARKLADAYGGRFAEVVAEAARGAGTVSQGTQPGQEQDTVELLDHDDILLSLAEGCVRFQQEAVTTVVRDRVSRYVRVEAEPTPLALLAPYFHFEAVGDRWYRACTRMQAAAREVAEHQGGQILPVICTDIACLEDARQRDALLADYGEWPSDEIVLWINGFRQSHASRGQIGVLRSFLNQLWHHHRKWTFMLYGGYMAMLLAHEGMAAISHGILYGEDRLVRRVPPAGPPPDRYYFPRFHDFRPMSHAVRIVEEVPGARELVCGCPTCSEVLDGDPRRLPLMWDSAVLKKHFLYARNKEKEFIRQRTLDDALAELRRTHERYHEAVSAIENPATAMRQQLAGLDYLHTWAEALSG